MVLANTGTLSLDLWLTLLLTGVVALQLHRALRFGHRPIAALARPDRRRRAGLPR